jgi:hypothetical protein
VPALPLVVLILPSEGDNATLREPQAGWQSYTCPGIQVKPSPTYYMLILNIRNIYNFVQCGLPFKAERLVYVEQVLTLTNLYFVHILNLAVSEDYDKKSY